MLDEGTTTRSTLEFAEQLKQAGVQIGAVPGRDYSGVVLTSTTGTLGTGFDLMADAVLNPAFDEKELHQITLQVELRQSLSLSPNQTHKTQTDLNNEMQINP